ncbi:hypothetical protein AcV5_001613 [Taiwanofungus camphoratus]|nr:hypothetical protein AcV5_001613 [Antrodia cinnamomea]
MYPLASDYAELNERLAKLSLANSALAQKEKDFHAWMDATDHWPLANALYLHRDPRRGRTHIVFEEVVYTREASHEARNKFRIVRCGVFRVADVLDEIERRMRLDPGEGVEYVKDVLDEMDST